MPAPPTQPADHQQELERTPTSIPSPSSPSSTSPASPPAPAADEGLLVRVGQGLLQEALNTLQQSLPALVLRTVLALVGALGTWLYEHLGHVFAGMNLITQTPKELTYANPAVVQLWGTVRLVANAALVLVVCWGGLGILVGSQIGSPYHEALELVPRLALAALVVNTSLLWSTLGIDANNALCALVATAAPFPGWTTVGAIDRMAIEGAAVLVYLVMGVVLLLQQLARLALIDLLLVVAPLGLLCWVLPETQRWARLWTSTYAGVVFVQFLQAMALRLGASLLAEPSLAGRWPQVEAPLLSLLVGIATLFLTLKLPGLVHGAHGDGLGFVRFYAYTRLAHLLSGLSSRTSVVVPPAAEAPPPPRARIDDVQTMPVRPRLTPPARRLPPPPSPPEEDA